jgi:SAM-dependent methyltransferase
MDTANLTQTQAFPHLDWHAREQGMSPETLVRIFLLEKDFHQKILATDSPEDRGRQYHELYSEVHRLQIANSQGGSRETSPAVYARLVLTFRRELEHRSILELGCGDGIFLDQVARLLPHGELCGLDTSDVTLPQDHAVIRFLRRDVVSFGVDRAFDVIFSHQLMEHIAPADVREHLLSIRRALADRGKFIMILPNRYWGPQDITRIVDNTYSGRVPAQGSHLNESSYSELVPQLEAAGFRNIRTILPFAHHFWFLRDVRVRPWLNSFIERHGAVRQIANRVRSHGRPVFKNPIALIAEN